MATKKELALQIVSLQDDFDILIDKFNMAQDALDHLRRQDTTNFGVAAQVSVKDRIKLLEEILR